MRYLLITLLLLPLCSSAQLDTIVVEGRASQLYSAMSANGLKTASLANIPTVGRDNFPVGVVLSNSRATFYIWRNTCPTSAENAQYMHIGPTGCWQQATNNYLTADWCLMRVGDTFRIDMQCLWDSLNYYYPIANEIAGLKAKIKADSNYAAQTYAQKSSIDTAFWNNTARQWNARKNNIVYTDSSYSNPPWLTSLDISKVPTAATQSFVNTGVQTLKTYSDNTFQTKGSYLTSEVDGSTTNELQSLSISGNNLSLSSANTVTLPTSIGPTGATGPQGPAGPQGATGPAGTYTATSPIDITGSVISYSGLKPVSLPNVTVGENAVIAINAGVRNVVVTCTGVLAGDRILVTPTTAPAGYMIGAAVATAANQITVQVNAPLLAIGASYSIVCTVTAFR